MAEGNTDTQATEGTPAPEGKGKGAAAFEPITTQEAFDEAFNKRWGREKAKYDGFDAYKADSEELKRLKDADKPESDRLRERAEAAEGELERLKAAQQAAEWKKEASEASGVPVAALHGATKEEIDAVAEELKPYFKKGTTPQAPGQGRAPAHTGAGDDPLRGILARR
jgi:hypothetical protein